MHAYIIHITKQEIDFFVVIYDNLLVNNFWICVLKLLSELHDLI